jgi:Predicted 3-hydroxylacyl-(acyl carrier protein) dehydratase
MIQFPIQAETLLPHKGAMCCIDSLLFFDGKTIRSEVSIRPDHALLDGDTLDRSGFIELAAQTAGLLQGLGLREKGESPLMGMLVGVQNFEILADARLGDTLCVSVTRDVELADIHVFVFTVIRQEMLLAKGQLKVYIPGA